MKTSDKITVTDGRLRHALKKEVSPISESISKTIVKKEVDSVKIRMGNVTKFFPYVDKAEVRLNNSKRKVFCKIMHRFGGDLIDFFTPLYDEVKYSDKYHEKYIVPRASLDCFVVKLEGSKEWVLLGYYVKDEIVGFNPASSGNLKLYSHVDTNDYWIKFGVKGLELRLPSKKPSIQCGDLDKDMVNVDYATVDDFDEKILEFGEKLAKALRED